MIFGYLREHSLKCKNADKEHPLTGLDIYLAKIFPEVSDWVYDKTIPNAKIGGKTIRKRPDYRSEKLKMIVEFDGLQHYQNPMRVISDFENDRIYKCLGYEVIRIPYFIQLSKDAIKRFFNVDVENELFDDSLPSFGLKWKNTPAFMCPLGVKRCAGEFLRFEKQLATNIAELKKIDKEELSGLHFFMKSIDNCRYTFNKGTAKHEQRTEQQQESN